MPLDSEEAAMLNSLTAATLASAAVRLEIESDHTPEDAIATPDDALVHVMYQYDEALTRLAERHQAGL